MICAKRRIPETNPKMKKGTRKSTTRFDYIELFYNRTRRHSHIGGVSPEAFETASKSNL